jgi:hypothetical protein
MILVELAMRAIGRCSLLAILLQPLFWVGVSICAAFAADSPSSSEDLALADRFACGRNCVYMFLRLQGIPCDFDRVR